MIDTKALRSRVLELAIQGKLTEQLAEDGTADELYTEIQAEKQQLIKEGKLKKEKPLPEIKPEEVPFEIPENWKWVRWGNLSESIQYGYNAPAKQTGRIRMVRITDIQNNSVVWDSVPFCDIDESSIQDYLLHNGDILFARTGGTVGKSFIVTNISEEAVFAGYLIRTRYNLSLSGSYLKFFMESRLYWKQLQYGTTATAQPNCNAQTLSKMMLPLPPLAEQKRIVARVEEIFRLLDAIDAAQEQYAADAESLKAKLITAGIQGKLTEQLASDGTAEELYQQIQAEKQRLIKEGKIKREKPLPEIKPEEVPFEIPENWKWVRWGEIVNIVSARRVHQSDWKTEGVPFYRAREIARLAENGYVDNDLFISEELYNEFSKSGIPHAGDIMISAVGTLGKAYVVKADDKFYYKDASVLCIENIGHIIPEYLIWVMRSVFMRSQIASNSGGTTVDTLTMVRMIKYLFPLPPLAEQKRIAETLERVLGVL